ncbi:MAG: GTPase Era [Oscillospiraceae bacterium]|nr:GTPase Era [Oscillospiraceae bacterium]MDY6209147.1 GTPase Era [Oscillospiraceae bacterium]
METKSVFVTIAGRANAGKSSLLNKLIGEKIAMVTEKPQTTRTKITGVLTEGEIQYVFIDTPGIQIAKNKLGEHMNRAVQESVTGIDAIIYVADVTKKINDIDRNAIEGFKGGRTPVILLINKIDLLDDKGAAAERIAEFSELMDFHSVIPVSVSENDGLDILMDDVRKLAVPAPHYFPEDSVTDQPEKVIMSEIIREKVMILMHDEIPHGIAVTIEQLDESVTRSGEDILNISATIFCERDSHKGMVIGKGGAMLKKIGAMAREELEEFFRIRVNLQLWVKVKEDWRNREGLIRNFGLSNNTK